jgi:hypothetical protein
MREIGRLFFVVEILEGEESIVLTTRCAREARDELRRYSRGA